MCQQLVISKEKNNNEIENNNSSICNWNSNHARFFKILKRIEHRSMKCLAYRRVGKDGEENDKA